MAVEKGTIFYANGNIYSGELLGENTRHGRGFLRKPSGTVMTGHFNEDKMDGWFKIEYINGDIFEGEYKDNKRNGLGISYYKDGTIFEAYYVNGEPQENATWTRADNVKYKFSNYKNGGNGPTVIEHPNGTVVKCNLTNGIAEGPATISNYSDGIHQEGYFKNGTFNITKKKFNTKDGGIFVREFADGKVIDGKDAYILRNGDRLEGNFPIDGDKAQLTLNEGKYIFGTKVNKKNTGLGGTTFEGKFKNNFPNGNGQLTLTNGEKCKCLFENNRLTSFTFGNGIKFINDGDGFGDLIINEKKYTCRITDGKIAWAKLQDGSYEGEFKNGLPNGYGKLRKNNNDVIIGNFKNGVPHGKVQFIRSDTNDVLLCEFKNGKMIDNNTNNEYLFKNYDNDITDPKTNETMEFASRYIGPTSNGLPNGNGSLILSNNIKFLEYKCKFENGKLVQLTDKNGDVYEGSFKYNIPDGKIIRKTKNGDVFDEVYSNGKLERSTKVISDKKAKSNTTKEVLISDKETKNNVTLIGNKKIKNNISKENLSSSSKEILKNTAKPNKKIVIKLDASKIRSNNKNNDNRLRFKGARIIDPLKNKKENVSISNIQLSLNKKKQTANDNNIKIGTQRIQIVAQDKEAQRIQVVANNNKGTIKKLPVINTASKRRK